MNKKVIRQFAQQFGKEWECLCKAPFGVTNLEIISESDTSLLAHYICPNCGREQMLAASITGEKIMDELQTISVNQISSDDVLDIREELKTMRPNSLRGLLRSKVKTESPEAIEKFNPPANLSSLQK